MEKLLLPARRRVEQQIARVLEKRAALMVRHAFQHLKLHTPARARFRRQHQPVGHVEKIVRRHAHAHRRQILRRDRRRQHAFEIRIRLRLRPKRRLRPAAHRRLHALHLHVRALHDPHRDRSTAARHPRPRPSVQLAQHPRRVRDVGLERDPGLHALQPRPLQRAHESVRRQPQVAVFLHVEIDELRHARAVRPREPLLRRRAIQRLQPVAQHAHRVLSRER